MWSFYIFVDSELSLKLQGNLRKEDRCIFYISKKNSGLPTKKWTER